MAIEKGMTDLSFAQLLNFIGASQTRFLIQIQSIRLRSEVLFIPDTL